MLSNRIHLARPRPACRRRRASHGGLPLTSSRMPSLAKAAAAMAPAAPWVSERAASTAALNSFPASRMSGALDYDADADAGDRAPRGHQRAAVRLHGRDRDDDGVEAVLRRQLLVDVERRRDGEGHLMPALFREIGGERLGGVLGRADAEHADFGRGRDAGRGGKRQRNQACSIAGKPHRVLLHWFGLSGAGPTPRGAGSSLYFAYKLRPSNGVMTSLEISTSSRQRTLTATISPPFSACRARTTRPRKSGRTGGGSIASELVVAQILGARTQREVAAGHEGPQRTALLADRAVAA